VAAAPKGCSWTVRGEGSGGSAAVAGVRLVMLEWRAAERLMPRPLSARAELCLAYLHDRHIGVTPALAEQLAAFADTGGGPWQEAGQRLSQACDALGTGLRPQPSLWREKASLYLLLKHVAAPVVTECCRRVGETVCFGASDPGRAENRMSAEAYRAYEDAVQQRCAQVLAASEEMGNDFWSDAALALLTGALRRPGFDKTAAVPGEASDVMFPDLPFWKLFRTLQPDFTGAPHRRLPDRPRTLRSPRERSGYKPKEGGVDGVLSSRNLADLPDMFLSEYLSHRALLAEKLVNGPFLARRRPPFRQPNRHALIIGACLVRPETSGGRFVKAAWIHAATRVGLWLSKNGMENSEIRWIERRPFGGLSVLRFSLEEIPPLDVGVWNLELQDILRIVESVGWRTGLIDRLADVTLAAPFPEKASVLEGLSSALRPWLTDAVRASWTVPARPTYARSIEEFGACHAQIIMEDPQTASVAFDPSWSVEEGGLVGAFNAETSLRQSLDFCFAPRRFSAGGVRMWSAELREAVAVEATSPDEPEALRRRFGDLVGWFVHSCVAALMTGGEHG